jgi:1,4-dihydroxy-2-naphthoate octaprenyltransferase
MPQVISSSNSESGAGASPPVHFSFKEKSYAALQLLRPANSVTAMADVLAGVAVAFFVSGNIALSSLVFLVLSGGLLYAGGVALNDACDTGIDAVERPERPIPSGRTSRHAAFTLAYGMLGVGLVLAFFHSALSASVASGTVAFIALYNFYAKKSPVMGPITMGLCRMGSLLLGISASTQAFADWWALGLLPLTYVAAITLVGRGEADGKNPFGKMAFSLVLTVIFLMGSLAWYFSRLFAFPYLALFAACVLPAFWKALKHPNPTVIRGAVKAGVLSLIMLDAAIAAIFGGWMYALVVLMLFPVSRLLARLFPVA